MKSLFKLVSRQAREKRGRLFRSVIPILESTTVLDLGSEMGHAIHRVLAGTPVRSSNVFIADISPSAVAEGARLYGFNPIVLDGGDGLLPFPDAYFDVVYCSSVIEHVTLPKSLVWRVRSGREFRAAAKIAQARFAAEIRRVGRAYFVQTPYKHFPVESHSWLPFLNWAPRPLLIKVLRVSNRYWVKRTKPDFQLLDYQSFKRLFPDAEIHVEWFLGLPKSLVAVRRGPSAGSSS